MLPLTVGFVLLEPSSGSPAEKLEDTRRILKGSPSTGRWGGMSAETLCFTCGLPAGEPLRLNHLPNGSVCPTCRDRLLDSIPAPFPAPMARDGVIRPGEGEPQPEAEAPTQLRLDAAGLQPETVEDEDDFKPSA